MSSNSEQVVQGSTGPLPSDARACLGALVAARRERALAESRELELAAHFADQCQLVDAPIRALPGAERMVSLGGDGAPEVAEFGSLELAAALGIRDAEATALMRDALDLRHRMPRLWARTMKAEVPVWRARKLAGRLSDLDKTQAQTVDERVAPHVGRMAWVRLEALVEGLVLEQLPTEKAERRRGEALDRRRVTIGQSQEGISWVEAALDASDAIHLDATVDQIARVLAEGGNRAKPDALRAMALGILAVPARALQLQQASLMGELPDDAGCPRAGQPGHTCGAVTVDPAKLAPHAELVVHLTDFALAEGMGIARAEKIGPQLAQWASDLLDGATVHLRPVIDANRMAPADSYECPATMRRGVELRNPFEAFPWSTRRSTGLDLDHTRPWAGGPTHPDNLGPLSRKVHRAKTHGGWQLSQPVPGTYLWRSPLGFHYLVTPSETFALDPPLLPPPHAQPLAA